MNNNTTNTTEAATTYADVPDLDRIELMGPVSLHMTLIEASEAMDALWNDEGGWEQGELYAAWANVEAAVMACLHGRDPRR